MGQKLRKLVAGVAFAALSVAPGGAITATEARQLAQLDEVFSDLRDECELAKHARRHSLMPHVLRIVDVQRGRQEYTQPPVSNPTAGS